MCAAHHEIAAHVGVPGVHQQPDPVVDEFGQKRGAVAHAVASGYERFEDAVAAGFKG